MTRLVIIDGNAILHRAFHALPPLTSPDGTLTNAVYGFASMLLRLVADLAPTHVAVAFDRPKPTFRKELYGGYQIKRPKMDNGLVIQIPLLHDLLASMKVPVFEQDGFEADDVIGTICKHAKKKKIDQVIIVTGDRDLLQLVTENIRAYMPTKGLSEAKLYGPTETTARVGVSPSQIPDYKALAGDQSDNYPGVPGIGPKTAVGLVHRYHTIEHLYAALERGTVHASNGIKEKLKEHKELAILSKALATIRTDVPGDNNVPPITEKQFVSDEALRALQRLGFQSLVKRLQKNQSSEKPQDTKKKEERKKSIDEQMSLV
jgi:DNA polymerase-1